MKTENLKALLRFSGYVVVLLCTALPFKLGAYATFGSPSLNMILWGLGTIMFPVALFTDFALRNNQPPAWFDLPFQRLLRLAAGIAWIYVVAVEVGAYLTVHQGGDRL